MIRDAGATQAIRGWIGEAVLRVAVENHLEINGGSLHFIREGNDVGKSDEGIQRPVAHQNFGLHLTYRGGLSRGKAAVKAHHAFQSRARAC